jgi:hypothetical protein
MKDECHGKPSIAFSFPRQRTSGLGKYVDDIRSIISKNSGQDKLPVSMETAWEGLAEF